MKDKPETLIQPTMGIKWNLGSLLDMEAHMPSATQNNSKRTKRNDRIPSTNPGAEPPRDTRYSGSARSHSTHLETSSSDRT